MKPIAQSAGTLERFGLAQKSESLNRRLSDVTALSQSLQKLRSGHLARIGAAQGEARKENAAKLREIWSPRRDGAELLREFTDYAVDFAQRSVLFLDIMRDVGNAFNEQMAGERTPVLVYDYEMALDGRKMSRPVNYALVRIIPPEGTPVDPMRRPFMIIDPRAGHGPGIGGFKLDSEVGVALAHGHAVYFVIFFPDPEPGQTLADVCAAEGLFVREVSRRHPGADKPAILGNCQGGWAAALVAASNPYVTGPIVLNGAPLSYWAGERGKNPLRYKGGLKGGAMPVLLLSDLGNGRFDGANLVFNFESMNPGNTWWSKYYNVFANVDSEGPRFKAFEKWWSSFYDLNEAEIRWIVENLFIGDKLERGDAMLGGRGAVDLRKIKSPIIIFASKGDDITPPPQALAWIAKVYGDEREIRARGQKILYIVHEDIGHLGIFVSAKVALKEHDRIVSTLDAIEALAPGLYEMQIEKLVSDATEPSYLVGFEERTLADLNAFDDGAEDEAFEAVARLSEFGVDLYEMLLRPTIQALATPASAQAMARAHPLRARRVILSDRNPVMPLVAPLAAAAREARKPVAAGNPFFATEKLTAAMIEQSMNFWSDLRGAFDELAFFAIYSNPLLSRLTDRDRSPPASDPADGLRELPLVNEALANLSRGGFAEAVIRMLVLLARSRGEVRQTRLERSRATLQNAEPFKSLGESERTRIIHEQTLIIDFEPEAALATLPDLLPIDADRRRALELVKDIVGDVREMSEPTIAMFARLRQRLGAPDDGALVRSDSARQFREHEVLETLQ
ncbi:conserved hypothetical protein [Methylocella silvestris BL2]|uniref:Alpha/beta hydrolase n=1 Tax=Methylocella silvestris (strain DSM 15510 / CIP 108128 / LMG 27833 / NCIMB 13906 / BL2) TaxID=395965 RepID=B8EIS0_METSB|nr:DUF3141 domain-containing protein [Methylocella silvestris]ACK51887.1 conserved hypothetical protein [Methylocella silvestris BL2]